MNSAASRVKALALALGADLVGVTTTEILADGPPSADPCYVLPTANSVISFAIALERDHVRSFISKQEWRPHCMNRKFVVQKLYTIGDAIARRLRSEGFEAEAVDVNNNYRPEENARDVTEMTAFHPDFAHRYAALAAGIGRLGWSGNLLTKDHGALVELGSVLTSARLTPDAPLGDEDHPCDKCKMCSRVCPVGMITPAESTQVTVAGITETISRKRPNTCCWIGCTGYEGLAASGTWSNWSPYRLGRPLPRDKQQLDALCISLQKADPQTQDAHSSLADYRRAIFDPDWFYYTVCGFCRNVCWPERKDRFANRKLIVNSGTAVLNLDGSHAVAGGDAVEVQTPFGLRVIVPQSELLQGEGRSDERLNLFPLDREVIRYLKGAGI